MQRRPTSFDIAALARVSQPTVSRALNNSPSVSAETRARVLAAAEQLNYKVDKNASGLRRSRSRTLALLFEEASADASLINPFYLSMLGAMVRKCADTGYDLLISFQQLSSDWHVDYADTHKADGIILLGYGDFFQSEPSLRKLVERGTHFVRWGCPGGAKLGADNEQGGFDATQHLLQSGRRSIAFIGTADPGHQEVHDRWRGYCGALKTAGIDTDDNLSVDAEPSEQAGREAVEELVRRGARFDAVFAASDVAAIGAMHALQKLGRAIPEEVAIVGFDDIPAASLSSPPLSTVRQDSRRAGEALVEAAVEAVEYGNLQTLLLPVKLIVRESSRPA
jgi:DNA-binding LacI/PurR family transcriptional regulator